MPISTESVREFFKTSFYNLLFVVVIALGTWIMVMGHTIRMNEEHEKIKPMCTDLYHQYQMYATGSNIEMALETLFQLREGECRWYYYQQIQH